MEVIVSRLSDSPFGCTVFRGFTPPLSWKSLLLASTCLSLYSKPLSTLQHIDLWQFNWIQFESCKNFKIVSEQTPNFNCVLHTYSVSLVFLLASCHTVFFCMSYNSTSPSSRVLSHPLTQKHSVSVNPTQRCVPICIHCVCLTGSQASFYLKGICRRSVL